MAPGLEFDTRELLYSKWQQWNSEEKLPITCTEHAAPFQSLVSEFTSKKVFAGETMAGSVSHVQVSLKTKKNGKGNVGECGRSEQINVRW